MSKISGKETKPEILIRKFLFAKGFRYRKNVKDLPGKPDIVLKKHNAIIFIHGCFWHGHKECKKAKIPVSNNVFWKKKISSNVNRDKKNEELLEKDNWNVIIIWQCEINTISKLNLKMSEVIKQIIDYDGRNTTFKSKRRTI